MKLLKSVKTAIAISSLALFSYAYAGTLTESDANIVSAINAKIAAEKAVSKLKVNVTSHDGVVTLSGKVNTDEQATRLIEISESVDGVKDVESPSLKAKKSKHSFADASITAKVKGTFIREKLFGDRDIDVTGVKVITTDGVVYLTGNVDTQDEADNAAKFAKTVVGVKSVDSKLEVKPAS